MLAFTGWDRREGPGRLAPTVGALGERLFGVPFLLPPKKKPQKEKHLGAFEGVQPIPDGRGEKATPTDHEEWGEGTLFEFDGVFLSAAPVQRGTFSHLKSKAKKTGKMRFTFLSLSFLSLLFGRGASKEATERTNDQRSFPLPFAIDTNWQNNTGPMRRKREKTYKCVTRGFFPPFLKRPIHLFFSLEKAFYP